MHLLLNPECLLFSDSRNRPCSIGVVIPDVDLQGEPLPKVLTSGYAESHKEDEKDAVFSEVCVILL